MKANQAFRQFREENDGALSLTFGLAIIGTIIGAVVAIAIVAALFPTYLGSIADITGSFNDPNTTTGDATADTLLPVFGLLVAFGGLFAIVGLVMLGIQLRKGS